MSKVLFRNKNILAITLFCLISPIYGQLNTDIYLCSLDLENIGASAPTINNITKRSGYDNQPFFSNDGKRIYYSANYTGKTDIYCYDLASQKTFTITNTPATSEFSPMETPDGKRITCVFIEKDTITQRIWNINLKNRKEKLFTPYSDSIGYYWPLENEWASSLKTNGSAIRKVNYEYELAVFVLGNNEANHSLRIITPTRKFAKEKWIDDSIGRCIRTIDNKHTLTYVKKISTGNYLKFYDLYSRKVVATYLLGSLNEDYCWSGNNLIYSDGSTIKVVNFSNGFDKPTILQTIDFSSQKIKNIRRLHYLNNQLVFVADDPN